MQFCEDSHFSLTDLVKRLCTKEEIAAEGKRTVAKFEKEFAIARNAKEASSNRNSMRHTFYF